MARPQKKSAVKVEYNLGERLKFLRTQRKLSQSELGRLAELSQSIIAQIETGRKDPSVSSLEKIAKVLDVHIAVLFSAEDVHVFDLPKLRRKYTSTNKLTPHLYMALGRVVQFAKDIGFIK